MVSSGWDNKAGLHSARFMMIGTNNRSTIDGMIAGLRFLKKLGKSCLRTNASPRTLVLVRKHNGELLGNCNAG